MYVVCDAAAEDVCDVVDGSCEAEPPVWDADCDGVGRETDERRVDESEGARITVEARVVVGSPLMLVDFDELEREVTLCVELEWCVVVGASLDCETTERVILLGMDDDVSDGPCPDSLPEE